MRGDEQYEGFVEDLEGRGGGGGDCYTSTPERWVHKKFK